MKPYLLKPMTSPFDRSHETIFCIGSGEDRFAYWEVCSTYSLKLVQMHDNLCKTVQI